MSEDRSTAVIIAGLNVKGQPMPYPARFSDTLKESVLRAGLDLHTEATGLGHWQGESERVLILAGTIRTDRVRLLRSIVADDAEAFGQEAIGFVVSPEDQSAVPAQAMFSLVGGIPATNLGEQ